MLHLLLRIRQSLITQMAQTAVCNRTIQCISTLPLAYCSRSTAADEHTHADQELMANMLGVRREASRRAAGQLQSRA